MGNFYTAWEIHIQLTHNIIHTLAKPPVVMCIRSYIPVYIHTSMYMYVLRICREIHIASCTHDTHLPDSSVPSSQGHSHMTHRVTNMCHAHCSCITQHIPHPTDLEDTLRISHTAHHKTQRSTARCRRKQRRKNIHVHITHEKNLR